MSKFTWYKWDYDCDGESYVIRKSICPNIDDVPKWIIENDNLDPECLNPTLTAHLSVSDVKCGWCKYQVRTDWDNCDGTPTGGYYIKDDGGEAPINVHGKKQGGWFEVWIVRIGEWY